MTDKQVAKAPMPQPQRPQQRPAQPQAPVNHPAVADYVAQWNAMARENDALKAENHQLRYDLDCARQMITELQHISDHERGKKEAYQRWATRFDTMAAEIASLATTLRDEARQAAEPPMDLEAQPQLEPPPPTPPNDEVDPALAALAKKLGPRPDGKYS